MVNIINFLFQPKCAVTFATNFRAKIKSSIVYNGEMYDALFTFQTSSILWVGTANSRGQLENE